MKREGFVLFLILFCAAFLRFWQLPQIPPHLSHDEVAIGYNAWSILQTGKDEYGTSYPLLFRSFDDFKLPGYIYATVLSEKTFGLNEMGVRFPSAFFGVLTVLAFYYLVKAIIEKKREQDGVPFGLWLPLVSAALLAINPWHINFSRAAFEANGSLFFIVLGGLFLVKSTHKSWYLLLAAASFATSVYFYYTARILVPMLLLINFFAFKKHVFKSKKWVMLSILFGILLLAPLIPSMFREGQSRISQVSIFEDRTLTDPYLAATIRHENSLPAKILYNRRVAYLHEFFDNYLKNFAPDFYFVNGTGPMGLLYLWEIPFFFAGMYFIVRMQTRFRWLILGWFFIVPIVGGLTTGQPNALRTLANVPMAVLFTGTGVVGIFWLLRKKRYHTLFLCSLFVAITFFFARFLILYFDYQPRTSAGVWGDGHKQVATFINQHKDEYDVIYVTGEFWRPYIYMLFYMQYPPKAYQESGSREGFTNLVFGQASWDRGEGIDLANDLLSQYVKKKTLFILSPKDFQAQDLSIGEGKRPYVLKVVDEIDGTFVKPAFFAITLQ